jgi:MoaA/NifB/PqqE/SkfB family radical SAM enzyme
MRTDFFYPSCFFFGPDTLFRINLQKEFDMIHPFVMLQGPSRWVWNTLTQKPWAISIEVTHNCTADCFHCDKGETIPDEKQATAEEYRRIVDSICPIVVQISGGEPLMRKDILDIIRRQKNPGRLPVIVFVTNASLLTEEKYDELKNAGVDQFSISIDFPDSRHDENRRVPGLFAHLNTLIPSLTARGNNDITMITAVHKNNYSYLLDILNVVRKWGAKYNLSMYTAGRTGNFDLMIASPGDLKAFRKTVDSLIEELRKGASFFSTEPVLNRYYRFFENGGSVGNCMAGIRSLVVNPDGTLCPCAMKKTTAFGTHKELRRGFSKSNTCDQCFISLRANTEKPIRELVKDIWANI